MSPPASSTSSSQPARDHRSLDWMNGLLALVVRIETGQERFRVVPVHRTVETLDNCRRLRFHCAPMAEICPFLRRLTDQSHSSGIWNPCANSMDHDRRTNDEAPVCGASSLLESFVAGYDATAISSFWGTSISAVG